MFADDTQVYHAIESPDTLELLQNDVGESEYWSGECKILYNKCHHVHKGENTTAIKYEMAEVIIEVQSKE